MVYLFLADGFEEAEALVPWDCMKRAKIGVLTVGVGGEWITSSKGLKVKADILPEEMDLTVCTGVVLPGGMPGMENLYASGAVKDAVSFCAENGLLVASICAAPSIPGRMGLLKGRKAVCFPGFEENLQGHIPSDQPVEADGPFITAKGAGCVFPFVHKIAALGAYTFLPLYILLPKYLLVNYNLLNAKYIQGHDNNVYLHIQYKGGYFLFLWLIQNLRFLLSFLLIINFLVSYHDGKNHIYA